MYRLMGKVVAWWVKPHWLTVAIQAGSTNLMTVTSSPLQLQVMTKLSYVILMKTSLEELRTVVFFLHRLIEKVTNSGNKIYADFS